jgi:hypothetical protein
MPDERRDETSAVVKKSDDMSSHLAHDVETIKSVNAQLAIDFEARLDVAFERLAELTKLVLESQRDNLTSNPGLLQSVMDAKSAFQALLLQAETALKSLGGHSEHAFVDEDAINNLANELAVLKASMESEHASADHTRESYWDQFCAAQRDFEDAERRLRDKENDLDVSPLRHSYISSELCAYAGRRTFSRRYSSTVKTSSDRIMTTSGRRSSVATRMVGSIHICASLPSLSKA